jgi:glycerone phosphate O-acyltransferase
VQVRVDPADLEAVKQAVKRGPVLILPNHRSYMDFLIVSYIFFFAGVPVPAIAAGQDFLSMGPITALLRRCGAFFMRRSFKVRRGHYQPIQAFTEGGALFFG